MREIKFRIWHTIKKRYLDPYAEEDPMMSLTEDCENWATTVYTFVRETREWSNLDSLDQHIVIQQYTGLKDKDGQDIYEGDLLSRGEDYVLVEAEFRSGCFWCGLLPLYQEKRYLKVVGNINEL